MRPTRSASVSKLVRATACGLALIGAGAGFAYQDGRLDSWTPSFARTEGVAAQNGDRDPARPDLRLPDLRVRPPPGCTSSTSGARAARCD